MTKKDYELIASVLKAVYEDSINDDERLTVGAIAHELAVKLKEDNPNFNRTIWYDAIYDEEKGRKRATHSVSNI